MTVQHYDTSKDDLKILSPQSTTLIEKVEKSKLYVIVILISVALMIILFILREY